jgi:predicted acylesterase/phospholipase RssA
MNLPFFAVAGDLTALTTVVFKSGPLDLALDASSAIPTVFRPIRHDDRMLVDGWVCDPLPAGVVRAAGFERVIAIDLSPRGRPTGRRGGAPPAAVAPPGLGRRLRICDRHARHGAREPEHTCPAPAAHRRPGAP